MKAAIVFAFLVMTGAVVSQALVAKDSKFECLSKIVNAEEEAADDLTRYSEDISSVDNINHLLLYYKGLSAALRAAIDQCSLNLAPATKRCERVHGVGSCEKVTSTFVNRKCPEGFRIEGCCQCVVSCPATWTDDGYWCQKPESVETDQACGERFERVGKLCVARCPLGWNDQGWRCMKPATFHVGHPFSWVAGDN